MRAFGKHSRATASSRSPSSQPISASRRPPGRRCDGACTKQPLQRLRAVRPAVEGLARLVLADLRRQRLPVARLYIRQVGDDEVDRLRQGVEQVAVEEPHARRQPQPLDVAGRQRQRTL